MAAIPLAVLFLSVELAMAQDAVGRYMYLRGEVVSPAFEGWMQNEDGSYDMYFGYMNTNWEQELEVHIGPDNYFTIAEPGELDDLGRVAYDPAEADQGQPAYFYPRRNPFLFTVRVPADFGDKEMIWTLTSNQKTARAYGTLSYDYVLDGSVISTEVGGAFGSLDNRLRVNLAPEIALEGDLSRSVRVGEPMTLAAIAHDPDDYPPRSDRRAPETAEELYSTRGVGSVVASGAPGLRFSWFVYRGSATHVAFNPLQLKAWMDTRVWGNSPWSPPYLLPEVPADNRWVTTVTFDEPGEYVLRAVASDGSLFSYENVSVSVTR